MPKKRKRPRKAVRSIALRPRFMKLKSDVNCIPAGVYRLLEDSPYGRIFAVGKDIRFCVGRADDSLFESLRGSIARPILTTAEEFKERYYRLLQTMDAGRPFDPLAPITSCTISGAEAASTRH